MSKTQNKGKSEIEYLKGQIRALKSQLRQERKTNKELSKKAHFFEEIADEVTEEVTISDSCPSCGKGLLQEIDLKYVIITKCQICEYKETRKP